MDVACGSSAHPGCPEPPRTLDAMSLGFQEQQPSPADIDALSGPAALVFGTNWCGHCIAAQRLIAPALADHPEFTVIRAEDAPGRPLGRAFRIRLWPTLVVLRDGQEVARVVRPSRREAVEDALARATEA